MGIQRQERKKKNVLGKAKKWKAKSAKMAILPFPWTNGLKSMPNASLLKAKAYCLVHSKNPAMDSNLQGPLRPLGQLQRSLYQCQTICKPVKKGNVPKPKTF